MAKKQKRENPTYQKKTVDISSAVDPDEIKRKMNEAIKKRKGGKK